MIPRIAACFIDVGLEWIRLPTQIYPYLCYGTLYVPFSVEYPVISVSVRVLLHNLS